MRLTWMGLMGGAEGSLEREAASSVGRRKGVPQRPALAMTMSMVEAVGPKAMAALKAVRWEGQEVTSVWMKLMLGGVNGCSVSVYGRCRYVRPWDLSSAVYVSPSSSFISAIVT